jgi:MFS superfamily sulfate permease-like transporter
MILFTILAVMAIIAAIIAVVFVGVFGGATLMVFGDVIVCVLILWAICKLFFGKKK